MRYVTVVGEQRSGKTSFCQRLSGKTLTDTGSYCATIMTEHYIVQGMLLHDTPGLYLDRMELYYGTTDVFILMTRTDSDQDEWWERIHRVIPTAHWLLVCNGSGSFEQKIRWAKMNKITCCQVNVLNGDGMSKAIKSLEHLCEKHPERQDPVSLTDVAYRWIRCV